MKIRKGLQHIKNPWEVRIFFAESMNKEVLSKKHAIGWVFFKNHALGRVLFKKHVQRSSFKKAQLRGSAIWSHLSQTPWQTRKVFSFAHSCMPFQQRTNFCTFGTLSYLLAPFLDMLMPLRRDARHNSHSYSNSPVDNWKHKSYWFI